jgi:hypothetical protein
VSHSLPNPAYLDRCSVSQQLGALKTHTTDTLLFISQTTNVPLFKFRCNIFIGVRNIKEMPGSVASGTICIFCVLLPLVMQYAKHKCSIIFSFFSCKVTQYFFTSSHKRQDFSRKSFCTYNARCNVLYRTIILPVVLYGCEA